jgi:hypothetical protein
MNFLENTLKDKDCLYNKLHIRMKTLKSIHEY